MRSDGRRWRVALPWLADPSRRICDESALASLDWLLARADRSSATPAWREWLLEGADIGEDVLRRFPAGPCVRAAWTNETPTGGWACAAPVHLLAALDHLRLAAPAPLPLEEGESAALVSGINEQLEGSGFALHSVPRRGWLCACPADLECDASEPTAAIGDNLRDWLPAGRDAGRVRALVNEVQMILHENPLNGARAARGEPPVNSVWLWGFGSVGRPARNTDSMLVTDDDWLQGLWQLHGGQALHPAAIDYDVALTGDAATARIAIVAGATGHVTPDDPSPGVNSLLGRMRTALERGTIEQASIHTGSEVLDLGPRSRWRFWRRPKPLSGPLQ
jgi:hypothetical protein